MGISRLALEGAVIRLAYPPSRPQVEEAMDRPRETFSAVVPALLAIRYGRFEIDTSLVRLGNPFGSRQMVIVRTDLYGVSGTAIFSPTAAVSLAKMDAANGSTLPILIVREIARLQPSATPSGAKSHRVRLDIVMASKIHPVGLTAGRKTLLPFYALRHESLEIVKPRIRLATGEVHDGRRRPIRT